MPLDPRTVRRSVIVFVAAAVGSYYLWAVRAAGTPFEWGHDLDGYYNLLAQGFASGHLYLPIEPSANLLAAPDPWDPHLQEPSRMQDMVLFNRHYYLYFGAAPAALLFTPWRLVTRHDLPQNFALFLLCYGGFLFACGTLLRVLDVASVSPPPLLLGVLLLALGICQSVPYLMNRVAVYEVAIGGGYFCLSGAMYFFARGFHSRRAPRWFAASGLMFGLAVGCRPHLLLAGVVGATALAIWIARSRGMPALLTANDELRAFMLGLLVVGIALATYNYERFHNPFEFGFRYQLAGPGQNRVELAPRNLVPGVYYMLLSRPEFSPVFPWLRMVRRFPFDSAERHPLPPDYFTEPTVGALWLAPFIIAMLLVPRTRGKSPAAFLLWTAAASSLAVLLFLISTHLQTHRYIVDFLPLAVLAAIANLAIYLSRSKGIRKAALTALFVVLIGYSATANLALGIAGPYDDILRYRPATYVRLARWFSPTETSRPLLNPHIRVELSAKFVPEPPGYREPLMTIGQSHYCYFLYLQHTAGTPRLISQSDDSKREYQLESAAPIRLRLEYSPDSHTLTATVNGREVIRHEIPSLITAPAQVVIGQNRSDWGLTARSFTGTIDVLDKQVRPSSAPLQ